MNEAVGAPDQEHQPSNYQSNVCVLDPAKHKLSFFSKCDE
jgi:hypothetical protein